MRTGEQEPDEERGAPDAWAVISRVNVELESIDDIVCWLLLSVAATVSLIHSCIHALRRWHCCLQIFGDDRDDLVEQINLHGNRIESMDGVEAFSR